MATALSPSNRRRLGAFRANRRGYLALRLFFALFVVCLFAELITDNRPLLLKYRGRWFLPVLRDYPETAFGGKLPFPPDYRGRFMSERVTRDGWTPWPLIRLDVRSINYARPVSAPSSVENWSGTDDQDRDVLAQAAYGLRLSILFVLGLALTSPLLGICADAMQGYYDGWINPFGQRFIEVWSGLPMPYLLIILASLVQPGIGWLLAIMLLFSWTSLVNVIRAEFLRGCHLEYVKAVRTFGLDDAGVMFRHILPNAMTVTLTSLPFPLCGAMTTPTALDFLGLDLPPGSSSLGELVGQGCDNPQASWLGLAVFVVLTTLLSLLVFIGEAVRGAFDPRRWDEPGTVANGKPKRRL